MLSGQKTTHKKRGSTTISSSTGQSQITDSYPLLAKALWDAGEEKATRARYASAETATTSAVRAVSTTSSSGRNRLSITKTSGGTLRPKSKQIPESIYSIPKTPNYGDVNGNNRGERITVDTLADYLSEKGIYDSEEFKEHATQEGPNRGREIYRKLASKDWDKKIGQAIDIARSFTPNTPFRARVENYKMPAEFDLWKGTCTYNEYLELFRHHGIGDDKLRRWFKTLFGDNGKKNTIYMWGKADAGKTTIIKMFDAFYAKWEIGRCSAQNINSNFWLQDLYEKRLFHADEIVATQVNIDTLKLLLEGSDDLTTDIKYAKKVPIRGRPVMMATNDPIWINMSSAADPIRKRCEFIHMTRPWTRPVAYMCTRDKDILQYVQNRLFRELFPNGYDEWAMSDAFQHHVEELSDQDLMSMPPVDIDNFVSEMN